MGVHNLWELLAPVGRRVSVETLAGKKLAIDASIWMIQFIKAMRDEKGEMIRNAHLVGFFRRICKLLFLRVKPVFVFDGATPALKRRTVIARRRQRENAHTKIRKTAEKLLLNQLKVMRLKELQQNLQDQRQQSDLDPKLITSKVVHNAKGKRVVDETIISQDEKLSATTYNQEELDQMLAASIAAEEDGSLAPHASTSGAGVQFEEAKGDDDDEGDDDEEMIIPAMHGKVDPAVLAALPPSMQLDLLVQMRERLMAENRQRYQKVKKAPSRFSELQIQAYLKTVAFRREIDAVQKSAAGKGIGGMQTSRIASEANREFIFSSSFTGDKQVLASGGEEKTDTQPSQTSRADDSSQAVIDSITRSNQTEECFTDAAGIELPNDVETYLDERGRIRVSRVRAMGIRMTRDLQRNLDLMKEIEHESVLSDEYLNNETSNPSTVIPKNLSSSSHNHKDGNADPTLQGVTSLEISFETNGELKSADDEDLFARLVAGETLMNVSADDSPSQIPNDLKDLSASNCEWEEGVIGRKSTVPSKLKPYLADDVMDDDSGVEWEDGCASISKEVSPHPPECSESLSREVSEEAEFQEAIRRSLVDMRGHGDSNVSCRDLMSGESGLRNYMGVSSSISNEDSIPETKIPVKDSIVLRKSSCETQSKQMIFNQGKLNMPQDSDNIKTQLIPHLVVNLVDLELSTGDAPDRCLNPTQDKTNDLRVQEEINERLDTGNQEKHVMVQEKIADIQSSKLGSSMGTDGSSGVSSSTPYTLPGEFPNFTPIDVSHREVEAKVDDRCHESWISGSTSLDVENKNDFESKSFHNGLYLEKQKPGGNSSFMDNITGQAPFTEASLEEELLVLDEESQELGNEQRRLERNAESVSSEMFTECQELLQMFGLPYIIAPMEAEAQCAFMELASLVDGVVTDDSDAFLFGARSVYKNIFDDRKYVETYFMKDIENELGLDRDKLIRMALLLGSDYTEGISGIGIVNAIEVINAFPEEDGLRKFREWIESPDPSIFGKLDVEEGSSTRKRGSKVRENEKNKHTSKLEGNSASDLNMLQTEDENQKLKRIFMEKHRNVSKNWHIPATFPSDVVITAYASPQVDNSTDTFSWAKPDLLALHKVCWEKFGWGSKKADEVLLPVLKEYDKHETQLRLEAFYAFNEKFAKIRSKRIKSALKGARGNRSQDVMNDSDEGDSKSKKRRKTSNVEAQKNEVEKDSGLPEHEGGIVEKISKLSKRKLSNRRNTRLEAVEGFDARASDEATMRLSARNGSNDRGDRGRKKLSTGKQKKSKMDSCSENAGTSLDGEFDNEIEERVPEKFERPLKVRRSERPRKAVHYAISNVDLDYHEVVEDRCTTSSKLDGSMNEISHTLVTGNSLPGISPNNENSIGNLWQESSEDNLESGGGIYGEATEPNQVNFGDIGNVVVEDHLLEKCLKTCGGFRLEDDDNTGKCSGKAAESSQVNCGSDVDPLVKDHSSEEYLKTGGGFCLDDDEAADDDRGIPEEEIILSGTAEEEMMQSNPSQSISNYVSGENEPCKERLNVFDTEDMSNRKTSIDLSEISSSNDVVDREKVGGNDTMRNLRAMPNLRRKRRQT